MSRQKKTAKMFEKDLDELDKLIEKMERGDLTLEASVQLFEQGIALNHRCKQVLADAEQRVQILIEKEGQQTLAPFAEKE